MAAKKETSSEIEKSESRRKAKAPKKAANRKRKRNRKPKAKAKRRKRKRKAAAAAATTGLDKSVEQFRESLERASPSAATGSRRSSTTPSSAAG